MLCTIELEGERLGMLELPVCDGLVAGSVLADAIAAEFAWPILGRFFEHTVYQEIKAEWQPDGLSFQRGAVRLAEGKPNPDRPLWPQIHDWAGWAVFLQEAWGRPDWPSARFYDPQAHDPSTPASPRHIEGNQLAIGISEDLPNVELSGAELEVTLTVGGAAIGPVNVPAHDNRISAQELRAALTTASGFELCRACVREGLLGQSLTGLSPLRERLAEASKRNTSGERVVQLVIGASGYTKAAREDVREQHRRNVFKQAMRQFYSLPQNVDPPSSLLSNLIYGWGNEDWSALGEYITAFLRCAQHADGPILECGSGLSTLLLGRVAESKGNKVWSLEHNPSWAEKSRTALRSYAIKSVELCLTDLRDYGPYSWYAPPKEHMPSDFSLVVCDGPPGDTPGGRYGLLPIMKSHLKPGCMILLDDAGREAERETLARWSHELGVPYRILGSKKPFAMFTLPTTKSQTDKLA
ncbi:MAG: class I SAM-dependent methyltransferase [Anaerolineales bacterium]